MHMVKRLKVSLFIIEDHFPLADCGIYSKHGVFSVRCEMNVM